jgi:hypothetical protein
VNRYVFLDFDGVITNSAYHDARRARGEELGRPRHEHFDPACVARVQRLCDAASAEVVLSTSWKWDADPDDEDAFEWPPTSPERMEYLRGLLRSAGLEAPVVGATPNLATHRRGREIDLWLRRNGVALERTVVLDDLPVSWVFDGKRDFIMRPVGPRLVRTHYSLGGFTEERLARAMELFGVR